MKLYKAVFSTLWYGALTCTGVVGISEQFSSSIQKYAIDKATVKKVENSKAYKAKSANKAAIGSKNRNQCDRALLLTN